MPIGQKIKKKSCVIELTITQRTRLSEIADSLECTSGAGPTCGMPSWRVMVAGIADGVLRVTNPRTKHSDRATSPKIRAEKPRTRDTGIPKWWRPRYGNAMGLDYALKKSGMELSALLDLGLRSEYNPHLSTPEVLVGLSDWPAKFDLSHPHWWWLPDDDGTMDTAAAIERSGLSAQSMQAGGLEVDVDLGRLFVSDRFTGWTPKSSPIQNQIDPSTIPEPEWFIRSPIGAPVMRVPDAMEQSGESVAEIVANGAREITVNGMKLITGPVGSSWDFSRFTPGEKPKSGTNDS